MVGLKGKFRFPGDLVVAVYGSGKTFYRVLLLVCEKATLEARVEACSALFATVWKQRGTRSAEALLRLLDYFDAALRNRLE